MVYILQRFMDKSSKYYGRSLAVLSNGSGVTLSNFSTGWISQVTRHYSSIPVTSNSIHLCHTEKVFPLVMGAIKVVLDAAQRDEFRLHDGNDQQVAESLCRFGFDLDCIPTSLGKCCSQKVQILDLELQFTIYFANKEGNLNLTKRIT